MNPRVISVKSKPDFLLEVGFANGELGLFDVKPYLTQGIFSELKDISVFNTVKVFNGTVVWDNELDFGPDTIYLESKKLVIS